MTRAMKFQCIGVAATLAAATLCSAAKVAVENGACRGDAAVERIDAEYVAARGALVVGLDLCDKVDPTDPNDKSTIRFLFDYAPPFAMQADRNGDAVVNDADTCADTNDAVVSYVSGTQYSGPGKLEVTQVGKGTHLTLEVPLSELGVPTSTKQVVVSGDVVINKKKGAVIKRWPRRSADDVCNDVSWKVAMGVKVN
jgi:hypothetical protein